MGRWETVARGRTAWRRCRAIVALVAALGALGLGNASAADVSAGWHSPVEVHSADGYVYDSGVDVRQLAIDDQNTPSAHGTSGARYLSPSLDSTGNFYDPSSSQVAPGSLLDDAAFAQTTFRETFSNGGRFAIISRAIRTSEAPMTAERGPSQSANATHPSCITPIHRA